MSDETTGLLSRPDTELDEAVYSNFDHRTDDAVASELEARPGEVYAQHAAWNFCGYVWRLPDGTWVDQVWRYGAPVEDIKGGTLESVIGRAIEGYGAE